MSQTLRKELLGIVATHFVTVLDAERQTCHKAHPCSAGEGLPWENMDLASETMRGIATGWQCGTKSQQILGEPPGQER